MNYSELLRNSSDAIVDKWLIEVRADRQVESLKHLENSAIIDHLPDVLEAMASVLGETKHSDDINSIVQASLQHGVLRAEQGFDPSEIAREYCLLRKVIFKTLEPDFLLGNTAEVIYSIQIIDAVIDEAVGQCFKSYVGERLDELEQLQSQLKLNNEELTRLIRSNQDNVSFLAHELKSPLTSIIGYSDLFLRIQRQAPEKKDTQANLEHIERVLRSGRHLLRLINDILEISRFDAGTLLVKPSPTNVQEIMENVHQMMEPLARAKNLQMYIDCDNAPKKVITDSLQLQQIITNLVSNAIRYTDSGDIQVTCQTLDDKHWVLKVTDTGIGIAKKDLEKIFDPYFRVELGGKTYLPDSTGLGLAIVERLVKVLQGKITVTSKENVGSSFEIILPLTIAQKK